ncbi:MAG: 50S ribosomal protein L6 [Betaproteobacteria bacterium]|nr:50S ribosomal protein L6 [Betaproteobacteria bacterium]
MSRVGKYPVRIPKGVEVSIANDVLTAKGGKGTLTVPLNESVQVAAQNGEVTVTPRDESKRARMMWGTVRNLINNAVIGASEGFAVRLEITGVGYRAAVQGATLNLQLGYSHDINYPIPQGITIRCERPTLIEVSGASKQKVGQVASEIRGYRKPEPYKGKGIRYETEVIVRKEGKKK